MSDAQTESLPEGAPPFRYVFSERFPEILEGLGATLLVSTYQAGKLLVVRAKEGRLSTLLRSFDQIMGLAADDRRLVIGTRFQIWRFENAPDIALQLEPRGAHDACYVPRGSHVTGDVRVHDLAFANDELWFVNTRFSCLCTLDQRYSFTPRWRPPFVSELAAEDRCHLNGLAMVDGRPKYVTAFGQTNSPQGWREGKASNGCLIDVENNRIVLADLSMPHSPRARGGQLWYLNSGAGGIHLADLRAGRSECLRELPGYLRGLAVTDELAFVGLSRIRETSTFGGLPIARDLSKLKCGVYIVHLASASVIATLEFQRGVEEIFDVQLLYGVRFPGVVGLEKDSIQHTFVLAPQA